MFFRALLVFPALPVSLYALGAIQRTVVTQAVDSDGSSRPSRKRVRNRTSLL